MDGKERVHRAKRLFHYAKSGRRWLGGTATAAGAPRRPPPHFPRCPWFRRGHDRVPAPPGVNRRLGRGSFSIDVAEPVKAPKLRHPGLDPGSIPLPWKQPIAPGDSTASDWSVTAASMIWNGSWLGGRDDEASIFATFFPRLCRQHDLRPKSRTRCVNLVDAVRRAITAASWNSLRAAGICRMKTRLEHALRVSSGRFSSRLSRRRTARRPGPFRRRRE